MSEVLMPADYIAMLRSAMREPAARTFVLGRLEVSLKSIGIDEQCRRDILRLLVELVRDSAMPQHQLGSAISTFERRWRTHLDRAYFRDYEAARWQFAKRFVFEHLPDSLGRCLDVGCGRGCLAAKVLQEGVATQVVGIDQTDFSTEWRERRVDAPRDLSFYHMGIEDVGKWLSVNGKFDTILLFYVLHHSTDYWVSKTLEGISAALGKDGVLVVLEDSFVDDVSPLEDPDGLHAQWADWTKASPNYFLTTGYDVQAILDFVAVKLLARFSDVYMPCNYKTSGQWIELFSSLGYELSFVKNIGFPRDRDIDVPQGLFVVKRPQSTL